MYLEIILLIGFFAWFIAMDINPFKEQVITVGNKGSRISQEKIEKTKKLFKDATNDYSGIYAFYIYDINGDYYYGLNHQEVMQAASLIKLPVKVEKSSITSAGLSKIARAKRKVIVIKTT